MTPRCPSCTATQAQNAVLTQSLKKQRVWNEMLVAVGVQRRAVDAAIGDIDRALAFSPPQGPMPAPPVILVGNFVYSILEAARPYISQHGTTDATALLARLDEALRSRP